MSTYIHQDDFGDCKSSNLDHLFCHDLASHVGRGFSRHLYVRVANLEAIYVVSSFNDELYAGKDANKAIEIYNAIQKREKS